MPTMALTDSQRDLVTKWVAALRSGTYQQGKDRLRMGDRYCCLGVACDVIDPSLWSDSEDWAWDRDNFALLSPSTLDRLGLEVSEGYCQGDLTQLNDWGKTFEEIASYIESCIDTDGSTP